MDSFDQKIANSRNRPFIRTVTSICYACASYDPDKYGHGEVTVDYGYSTRGTMPCHQSPKALERSRVPYDVVLLPRAFDIVGFKEYQRISSYSNNHCKTCGRATKCANVLVGYACTECQTFHVRQHNWMGATAADFLMPNKRPDDTIVVDL